MVATLLASACYLILYTQIHYLIMNTQFQSGVMPSGEHGVMLAAIAILGSWLLLFVDRLNRFISVPKRKHWWLQIGAGALLGTIAYSLQQFLDIHTPSAAFTLKSVFYKLGAAPLTHAGLDPSWQGYVVFFATWLAIGGIRREVDEQRCLPLQIKMTAKAIALGFAASFVFAFPQWYAMLWAGTISTTLQLAAPWNPSRLSQRARN